MVVHGVGDHLYPLSGASATCLPGERIWKYLPLFYKCVRKKDVSRAKTPLSNSDHKIIHLIPTYKTALKRSTAQRKI